VDHSADPSATQCSATLHHPIPEEGEALPLFGNSNEELEYLRYKDACLEKQRKIKCLCTQVLGKNTHQHGESLDALAEHPAPKQPTPFKMPTKRATVMPPDYGSHKQKDLVLLMRKVKNVLEFDWAIYFIERDRMLFAKQYLVGDAVAVWDQYCAQHPEADDTWVTMRDLRYSWVAPTKHRTDAAFQKLCSVKQGPDQMVTSFSAYTVTTCKGTDMTDYNKRMFFYTRLRPEICAAIRKGEDYLTFDTCLEAGVEAETALGLDAEYNKAFMFTPKREAAERAGKDKGKSKAHHYNSGKGCSSQGASQRLRDVFRGRGHGRGCGGHGQAGHQ
jgi:hypothetical protein